MNSALEQFDSNIERTRTLVAVYAGLASHASGALDISDVLRAALVLVVSALDHYVHEVVRLGMLEAYKGLRSQTTPWQKFQVSLEGATQIRRSADDDSWLDSEIRERHGWQAFEQPEKIADAIRLVADVKLWDIVANDLKSDAASVKKGLKLIVDRRNKIAHEADLDPTSPGARWPVDVPTVSEATAFVERVVHSIHTAVSGIR